MEIRLASARFRMLLEHLSETSRTIIIGLPQSPTVLLDKGVVDLYPCLLLSLRQADIRAPPYLCLNVQDDQQES